MFSGIKIENADLLSSYKVSEIPIKNEPVDDEILQLEPKTGICAKIENEYEIEEEILEIKNEEISEAANITSVSLDIKHTETDQPQNGSCKFCKKLFLSQEMLNKHMIDTHETNPGELGYICNLCQMPYSSKNYLCRHMKEDHQIAESFWCDYCDEKFKKFSHGMYHMQTHKEYRPFKCDVCGKDFAIKYHFVRHREMHNTALEFTCDVCGKKMRRKRQLKLHLLTHADEVHLDCEICDRKFTRPDSLRRHIRESHKLKRNKKEHKCPNCDKVFENEKSLQMHSYEHNSKKTFICAICDNKFSFQWNLQRHIRTMHRSYYEDVWEKKHKCSECDKSFSRLHHLKLHAAAHRKSGSDGSAPSTSAIMDTGNSAEKGNIIKVFYEDTHGITEEETGIVVKIETVESEEES